MRFAFYDYPHCSQPLTAIVLFADFLRADTSMRLYFFCQTNGLGQMEINLSCFYALA